MKIYTKEGWLYYVQADHLSGEEAGSAVERLYAAGAKNVQVIQTLTKKNRPGLIFFIDTAARSREAVEEAIILELRVSGWHCFQTQHRHLAVDYLKQDVTIRYGGEAFPFSAEIKRVYGIEESLRPEHRSCEALKVLLAEKGKPCSLECCARLIREGFLRQEGEAAGEARP